MSEQRQNKAPRLAPSSGTSIPNSCSIHAATTCRWHQALPASTSARFSQQSRIGAQISVSAGRFGPSVTRGTVMKRTIVALAMGFASIAQAETAPKADLALLGGAARKAILSGNRRYLVSDPTALWPYHRLAVPAKAAFLPGLLRRFSRPRRRDSLLANARRFFVRNADCHQQLL